ncbi:hypothetical protein IAT38_004322 [Cryptococcus sp. DSM 104549]
MSSTASSASPSSSSSSSSPPTAASSSSAHTTVTRIDPTNLHTFLSLSLSSPASTHLGSFYSSSNEATVSSVNDTITSGKSFSNSVPTDVSRVLEERSQAVLERLKNVREQDRPAALERLLEATRPVAGEWYKRGRKARSSAQSSSSSTALSTPSSSSSPSVATSSQPSSSSSSRPSPSRSASPSSSSSRSASRPPPSKTEANCKPTRPTYDAETVKSAIEWLLTSPSDELLNERDWWQLKNILRSPKAWGMQGVPIPLDNKLKACRRLSLHELQSDDGWQKNVDEKYGPVETKSWATGSSGGREASGGGGSLVSGVA